MMKIPAILVMCCSVAAISPAVAADASVDAAVKVFNDVQNNPEKLKTFCAMVKVMDDAGDDEKKAEAADKEVDGYLKQLGSDFETAWNSGADLPEDSPDAKKLDDSLDALQSKCGD